MPPNPTLALRFQSTRLVRRVAGSLVAALHMAKFTPRVPLWLVVVACLVLTGALAPFAIVKKHKASKALVCDQCGIRLWIASDGLVSSSTPATEQRTLEHTALSRWFDSHITTNCQHTWRFNHSSGQTYLSLAGLCLWKISSVSGSSPTPPLVYFSVDDQARVESLLLRSPDACRSFIHARLQGKEETDE